MRAEFFNDAPSECVGLADKNGCVNQELFV